MGGVLGLLGVNAAERLWETATTMFDRTNDEIPMAPRTHKDVQNILHSVFQAIERALKCSRGHCKNHFLECLGLNVSDDSSTMGPWEYPKPTQEELVRSVLEPADAARSLFWIEFARILSDGFAAAFVCNTSGVVLEHSPYPFIPNILSHQHNSPELTVQCLTLMVYRLVKNIETDPGSHCWPATHLNKELLEFQSERGGSLLGLGSGNHVLYPALLVDLELPDTLGMKFFIADGNFHLNENYHYFLRQAPFSKPLLPLKELHDDIIYPSSGSTHDGISVTARESYEAIEISTTVKIQETHIDTGLSLCFNGFYNVRLSTACPCS